MKNHKNLYIRFFSENIHTGLPLFRGSYSTGKIHQRPVVVGNTECALSRRHNCKKNLDLRGLSEAHLTFPDRDHQNLLQYFVLWQLVLWKVGVCLW